MTRRGRQRGSNEARRSGRPGAVGRSWRPLAAGLAALAILVGLGGVAAPSRADEPEACVPRIDRASADQLRYQPFAPREISGAVEIELSNSGDAACRLWLGIEAANGDRLALEGPGGSITYRLRPRQGGFVDGPGPFARHLPIGIPPGRKQTVTLAVEVAPGVVVAPGAYGDRLRLRLFAADGSPRGSEEAAQLGLEVLPQAQANIAGAQASFGAGSSHGVIDFGTLETGKQRRAALQIRANTDVRILVRSENGGQMRHVGFPDLPAIHYSARFDGSAVGLEGPFELFRRPPLTLGGGRYPLELTVGTVGNHFAGRYRDTLIFSIEPR